MTTVEQQLADQNPFSTRFVKPGAIDYVFMERDVNLDVLAKRLEASRWQGQIVGPHGSGKTTLAHALRRTLESLGQRTILVKVCDGWQARRELKGALRKSRRGSLLVVDGYEQLRWPTRWSLGFRCRQSQMGLLAIAHRSVGLPLLYETRVTQELAERVVAELLQPSEQRLAPQEVERARRACGDNLRETLFALYDAVEQRRATAAHTV